jgi:CRP-like cAMP-binding protein
LSEITGSREAAPASGSAARAVLQAGQWFRSLPASLQDWLLAQGALRALSPGERLFSRGDPPCGLYGVVQGAIRVTGVSIEGKEALLTLVEPPQWFGEIALFDGLSRTHDAISDGQAQVLHVSQLALEGLLSSEPATWRFFGMLLAHKLRLTFIAIEETALLPAAVRLARRLLLIAEDYGERTRDERRRISVRQEQLAMMLSLSRQTTNQILRELETQGIARLNRGQIEILDLPRLRVAAAR